MTIRNFFMICLLALSFTFTACQSVGEIDEVESCLADSGEQAANTEESDTGDCQNGDFQCYEGDLEKCIGGFWEIWTECSKAGHVCTETFGTPHCAVPVVETISECREGATQCNDDGDIEKCIEGNWELYTECSRYERRECLMYFGNAECQAKDSNYPEEDTETEEDTDFNIEIIYTTEVSKHVAINIDAAKEWCEDMITKDIPDVIYPLEANSLGFQHPAIEKIDDLIVFFEIAPIDGPGGTLGSSGTRVLRHGSYLPVISVIVLDSEDVETWDSETIINVAFHELGHALGLGSIWDDLDLLEDPSLENADADTRFTGVNAVKAFNRMIDPNNEFEEILVPVENGDYGAGTQDCHWRNDLFGNEIFTGFYAGGYAPLSETSVRSFEDIGYEVDISIADPFTLDMSFVQEDYWGENKLDLSNDILRLPIDIAPVQ